jgi:glutamate formiminotransferase / 5-formyltetrahydrofolate cyclo-ligase
VLECVVNVSEGRDPAVIDELAAAAGSDLLDVHRDPHHHRSVWTLVGEQAARAVAATAVARIDLRHHDGVHPRLGAVDVVPFVPLGDTPFAEAVAARDRFAAWAGRELGLPCFIYGPERTLPDVRRRAFAGLDPTTGPGVAHPTAGAVAVGARPVLVAYNVWLAEPDVARARHIARAVRGPALRALGLDVGGRAQVSMNLVAPLELGPGAAFDAVAAHAPVAGAELVGLVPAAVLAAEPEERWRVLDLSADRTIEARLAAAGPMAGGGEACG